MLSAREIWRGQAKTCKLKLSMGKIHDIERVLESLGFLALPNFQINVTLDDVQMAFYDFLIARFSHDPCTLYLCLIVSAVFLV